MAWAILAIDNPEHLVCLDQLIFAHSVLPEVLCFQAVFHYFGIQLVFGHEAATLLAWFVFDEAMLGCSGDKAHTFVTVECFARY